MAFSTVKTNWADNEVVLPSDLNRIEGNTEAAAKTNVEQVFFGGPAYSMGTALSAFYEPAMNVAHTSRTGRVKLTAVICFENTSGATRTPRVSLARDGVNLLRNKPDGLGMTNIVNGGYKTVTLVYISGEAPIGAGVEYNLLVKEATGIIKLYCSTLIAEDI